MLSLPNVINRFKAKDTSEYEPVIRQNLDSNSSNSTSNNNVVQSVVDARRNRLWFFLVGITCCVVLIPFYVSSRDSSSSSSTSTAPPVTDTNIGDSLKNTFTTNQDNIPEEYDDDNFNTEIKSCLTSIKNLPLITTTQESKPKMSREASECIETLTTQGGTPPSLSSFSFHLFSTILNSNDDVVPSNSGNVLISPLSIASALALVLTGATNHSPCQTQLQSALSITSHLDMAVLHRNLMSSLQKPMHVDHVELNSANGIWIKEDQDKTTSTTTTSTILDSYVNLVKEVHDASASPLPQTYQPINDYIESKTNGMISNMMEGDVDPLTVAILVNAVYFKGLWQQSFNPDKSIDDTFFAKDKSGTVRRKAKFMVKEDHMEVAFDVDELNGASIVRLDYGKPSDDKDDGGRGGRHPPNRRGMMKRDGEEEPEFSAFFILPSKDTDGIDGVFTQLAKLSQPSKTSSTLPINDILSDTASQKIKLILPRFKLTTPTTSLTPHLQSLGIKDAFNGSDVFNQMSNDPDVHLSDMLHKAVMEVTEEGTVAAAATVGIMMTRSMPMPSPELRFDRPFGVLVVYKNGDGGYTPLFMGRVNDPEFDF